MRSLSLKSNRKQTTAIYARVSTDNQVREENGSVDLQIDRCMHKEQVLLRQFGEQERTKVYRDDGLSAKDTDRPAFQRLMRDLHQGMIRRVVVTGLDRVSRSVKGFASLVDTFDDLGVTLVCLQYSIDTRTAAGRLQLNMLISVSQFEREQTGERTAANMRARAKRGLWNGGQDPLGYRTDPSRSGYLVTI